MSARDPYDLLAADNSLQSVLKDVRKVQGRLFRKNVRADRSSEFSDNHDMETRATDDNGVVRAILSGANLIDEFGVDAYFALFDDTGAAQVYMGTDGITLIAEEYPARTFLSFISDDNGTLIAEVTPYYVTGGQAGMTSHGYAKEAGQEGINYIFAHNNDGTYFSSLQIGSDGDVYFDLKFGKSTVTGFKALHIVTEYSTANALQNLLYLDTYTSGAAAAGLGSAIAFRAENSNGDMETQGYLATKYVTVTDGVEDSKWVAGLTQGGTLYDYIVPLAKLVSGGLTTIATTETTIFDVPIPKSWLVGNNIVRFKVWTKVVTGTSRTITHKLYYDDTLMISGAGTGSGAATFNGTYEGILQSTGSNAQIAFIERRSWRTDTSSYVGLIENGTATEADNAVKNIKLTLQLGGAVTSAVAYAYTVELLNGT